MKKLQTILFILIALQLSSQDNTLPEIVSLSISPQVIDVTGGPQDVTFTVGATDDISGVNSISVIINLPDGNGTSASNEVLISGTILDGVWELSKTFSEFTDPGIAYVGSVWIFDVAGNWNIIDSTELANLGFDLDFEIINNNALPVEWFLPLQIKGDNILTWATTLQINNSHFEIEHSQDGMEYVMIDKIDGEGNSYSVVEYEYMHKNPSPGINYYRIKQVDIDGQFSYSNVASSVIENNEPNIYPNPASDRFFINYFRGGRAILLNQHGQKIKEIQLDQGLTEMEFSDVARGIYTLKINDGSTLRFYKI